VVGLGFVGFASNFVPDDVVDGVVVAGAGGQGPVSQLVGDLGGELRGLLALLVLLLLLLDLLLGAFAEHVLVAGSGEIVLFLLGFLVLILVVILFDVFALGVLGYLLAQVFERVVGARSWLGLLLLFGEAGGVVGVFGEGQIQRFVFFVLFFVRLGFLVGRIGGKHLRAGVVLHFRDLLLRVVV